MRAPYLDDGDVRLYLGDCVQVLAEMDAESVDAVVCDPPYALPGGFMGKAWDRMDGRVDVGLAYYLSGLIDGEGSFRVGPKERRCEFSMKLRRDDRAILEAFRRFLGHGRISDEPGRDGSRPQARLVIDTKDGCEAMVGFVRRFPLRAKKARDFEPWAEAVGEWLTQPRGNRWTGPADRSRLVTLSERVRQAREYREVPWSGHSFQDWTREWCEQAYRVLKPGGHLLAFGGTRTFHRLTCGIEDAGFEIRDCLSWLYGSGFPKSLDVSKAIDKAAGAEREVVRVPADKVRNPKAINGGHGVDGGDRPWMREARARGFHEVAGDEPATDAAREWQGWGTALKPAWEPCVVARKPLAGTVAENVQRYGTGALNIDGCRIGLTPGVDDSQLRTMQRSKRAVNDGWGMSSVSGDEAQVVKQEGRWPANVVLDEQAAAMLDAQSGERGGGFGVRGAGPTDGRNAYALGGNGEVVGYGDTGGASRFFYTAKASRADRNTSGANNTHPTVKPTDLMRWLVRLATPPSGVVLDPFAGSGSTLVAARAEGFRAIGIEREEEYAAIIADRLSQLSLFSEAI